MKTNRTSGVDQVKKKLREKAREILHKGPLDKLSKADRDHLAEIKALLERGEAK